MSDPVREALSEARFFLSLLPQDLGRGSLNGMRSQLAYKVDAALAAQPVEPVVTDLEVGRAWARFCLENCRLFAARHRTEEWAKTILRFCDDAGVKGSALRPHRRGATKAQGQNDQTNGGAAASMGE